MKAKQILLFIVLLLASCYASFSLFAQIPTSGLVAYWPMNGNYADAGPNGINGTNNGSTPTTNKFGAANGAMNFANPTSPVVQFATHPINANLSFGTAQNFSISFLLFTSSIPHPGGIYDNNLNYNGAGVWYWNANGFFQVQFNFKNGSVGTTNGALSLGTWSHVCCVRSGASTMIYINGVLNVTGAPGSSTPVYSFPGRIGSMFFNAQSPPEYNGHNGKIDELRIYNRALSVSEIVGLASTTLPLKLGDFTAVKKSNIVQLNWETISEQNTSYFEIERSSDGNSFTTVGQVAAGGNSTDKQYYTFTDPQPSTGTNFYRLKMADLDGTFSYSRVIAVKNDNSLFTLQLFPNPVMDILQVQWPVSKKEVAKIIIMDATGKQYYIQTLQLNEGMNAVSVPVTQLAKGAYYLIAENSGERQSRMFVKQ